MDLLQLAPAAPANKCGPRARAEEMFARGLAPAFLAVRDIGSPSRLEMSGAEDYAASAISRRGNIRKPISTMHGERVPAEGTRKNG